MFVCISHHLRNEIHCCDVYRGRKDPHSRAIVLTLNTPAHSYALARVLPLFRRKREGFPKARPYQISPQAFAICPFPRTNPAQKILQDKKIFLLTLFTYESFQRSHVPLNFWLKKTAHRGSYTEVQSAALVVSCNKIHKHVGAIIRISKKIASIFREYLEWALE